MLNAISQQYDRQLLPMADLEGSPIALADGTSHVWAGAL
jgi:hypothetical protein